MTANALAQSLNAVLLDELKASQALLKILEQENEALTNNQLTAIETLLQDKLTALKKMALCEQSRDTLLATAGLTQDKNTKTQRIIEGTVVSRGIIGILM